MRIFDVIEWADDMGAELVHRVPPYGSGDFRLGSQLIVRESQSAVFFRDGKSMDSFQPGRHSLETANLPVLAGLLGVAFGGRSPFTAEVYFVSTRVFQEMKWGTKQPVIFRDPEFKMVQLRAHGTFSMRVTDVQLFVNEICGVQGRYERDSLNDWMREFIVSRIIDTLGEFGRSILDLPMYYEELGVAVKSRVRTDLAKYGVEVVDFNIGAITPPDEVQQIINQRTGMSIVGNMDDYLKFQTAQAIPQAASQPGGMAGEGVGLGAGLAMGQAMAQAMTGPARAEQPAPPASAGPGAACPSCGQANPAAAKFCMKCGAQIQTAGVLCPKCGHQNPADSRFCIECGTQLAAAT